MNTDMKHEVTHFKLDSNNFLIQKDPKPCPSKIDWQKEVCVMAHAFDSTWIQVDIFKKMEQSINQVGEKKPAKSVKLTKPILKMNILDLRQKREPGAVA